MAEQIPLVIISGKVRRLPSGDSINVGLSLTPNAVGFSIAGGTTSKTLTVTNSITLSGTDSSTLNIGAGGTLGTGAYADISLYAPLSSPSFTGVPTAPTASNGTNTTQIATTAFVLANAAAAGVTSFNTRTGAVTLTSGDVTTALTYTPANIASPSFTGVPLAPTASTSTNTTQIATTAFVLGQVGTGTPLMDGSAAVGTSLLYARQDHVHPTDTSLALVNQTMYIGTTSVVINRASGALALTGITSIDGNAATVTTNANLTGDVTSIGNAATVVKINGTSLAGLATGLLKNTTITGVPSIASSGDVITALTYTPYNATNPANYIDSAGAPVQSFNTRTGAITLTSGDVTTALTYTPVNKTGDSMSGNLAMGSNNITGLPTVPSGADSATSKAYVDNLVAGGATWRNPIVDPDLNDVVSSVPGSPVTGATYIAYGGSYPQNWGTGAAAVVSGDIVTRRQDGTAVWIVIKNLAAGDRIILAAEHGTVSAGLLAAGFWTGDLAQYVSGNPGLTASWTFPEGRGQGGTPEIVQGTTVLCSQSTSEHYGHSYLYNATTNVWVEISGPGSIGDGIGLSYSGNVLNINLGAGISQLPSDEVGIDIYTGSGLMTTVDGTTSSTVTGAQLSLTKVGTSGTYKSVSTDVYGRVTAGTNPTTLAGFGITDAAPIASPTFTGVPLAPTASANTNTTQLATTAFVLGQAGTTTPLVDDVGAVGTSYMYARQDHVHPTDTTRAATNQTMYIGTTAVAINRSSAALVLTGITSIDGNAATVTTNANLTGEVTSVGNAATLTNSAVIGKVLTGYTSGAGTVADTDTILQAIQKLNGNLGITGATGGGTDKIFYENDAVVSQSYTIGSSAYVSGVTVTIATPGVFTLTSHGFVAGSKVIFSTTGALPTGIVAGTVYYVITAGLTANNFEVSATLGGSAINTTGTQSGVHSVSKVKNAITAGPITIADGATVTVQTGSVWSVT